ncbi:MAG TPA: DUF6434 domain-containing protein [Longimicrobium sp.]|nr:DUF6434 domain-containing protein [Longimicrobium sp.]
MTRPELTPSLAAEDFRAWYWRRDELAAFCRANGLPASGSKEALAERIEAWLAGTRPPAPRAVRQPSARMPAELAADTPMGPGWRCSQPLRAYFEGECGPGFRFNRALRELVARGDGSTLAQAVELYRASLNAAGGEIEPQFEYNRHMRAFFAAHPGATPEQARAAWWEARNARRRPGAAANAGPEPEGARGPASPDTHPNLAGAQPAHAEAERIP